MGTRVSDRIGAIAESATLAVDAKAKALKAAGRPVIGFGAGEPDFPTPDYIVEAAIAACREPKNHRYTPAGGLPELKEAIAAKTLRDSGLEVPASRVLITCLLILGRRLGRMTRWTEPRARMRVTRATRISSSREHALKIGTRAKLISM